MQSAGGDSTALVFMVLDVIEDAAGRYHIWGKTDDGRSVLCRVNDFAPYVYIAAPVHAASPSMSLTDGFTCMRSSAVHHAEIHATFRTRWPQVQRAGSAEGFEAAEIDLLKRTLNG